VYEGVISWKGGGRRVYRTNYFLLGGKSNLLRGEGRKALKKKRGFPEKNSRKRKEIRKRGGRGKAL